MTIIADLLDPDDPQGRTFRQVNAAKQHQIPIGALVEDEESGIRLYVVAHHRDCDQTPLYALAADPYDVEAELPGFANRKWMSGYSEDSLTVIRPPGRIA